jgi:hypothetical protein
VPLVFRVTNSGKESLTLYLMGRKPAADFRISDESGRVIWSRLRGQTMLGALRLYPLGAGEALVFRHVWNGHADSGGIVPPGEYAIRGVLLTDDIDGWASPPAFIRIER